MRKGQELARLVMEFMGDPAALGLLGLQQLAREELLTRAPGLHFGIELGIGEGGGGLVRKEPRQRWGLLSLCQARSARRGTPDRDYQPGSE